MSALDKASVREEIAKLKADFESLNREGKVTAETQALMKSLFLMVDLILSIFLERTTKKNAVNSSIPPSQSDKDDSALGQSGSNQKKRRNHGAPRNGTVNTQVLVAPVEQCQCCGESLINQGCIGHERRTKIDILFEKHVQHVDAQIKECPTCHNSSTIFALIRKSVLQYGMVMVSGSIVGGGGDTLFSNKCENIISS